MHAMSTEQAIAERVEAAFSELRSRVRRMRYELEATGRVAMRLELSREDEDVLYDKVDERIRGEFLTLADLQSLHLLGLRVVSGEVTRVVGLDDLEAFRMLSTQAFWK